MENQHKLIKNYRELSQEEIDLLNESRELAEQLNTFFTKLENGDVPEGVEIDKRWLAIAKTDVQKGMMSLTRSIARPTGF